MFRPALSQPFTVDFDTPHCSASQSRVRLFCFNHSTIFWVSIPGMKPKVITLQTFFILFLSVCIFSIITLHITMTNPIPFVTVPIVPSRRLSADDLAKFKDRCESNGENVNDVLSRMIEAGITNYRRRTNRGKTIRKGEAV